MSSMRRNRRSAGRARRRCVGRELPLAWLLAVLSMTACENPDAEQAAVTRLAPRIVPATARTDTSSVDAGRVLQVAGLRFPLPLRWERLEADHPRELRFRRGPDASDRMAAEIEVRAAGAHRPGDVEAAMRHWISRMQSPEGEDASRIALRSRLMSDDGPTVHFLEISGIYLRSMGGGPMTGGRTKALRGYRLFGAIVLAEHGTALFEIVGPETTARHAESELRLMLGAMEPFAGRTGTSANSTTNSHGSIPRR